MTNAPGFFRNEREEPMAGAGLLFRPSVDINRDFPYNTDPKMCMNTIAARFLYRLFAENLIVTSITFHAGMNVISYPWGSENHLIENDYWTSGWDYDFKYLGAESPDLVAFKTLGQAMNQASGPSFTQQSSETKIDQYNLGSMTDVVYPLGGAMEDWAYGAGWDKA